jgi:hypothetical protein
LPNSLSVALHWLPIIGGSQIEITGSGLLITTGGKMISTGGQVFLGSQYSHLFFLSVV